MEGKSIAWLGGVTGQNQIYMQIDDTEGGSITGTYWTKAGLGGYVSTADCFFPIELSQEFLQKCWNLHILPLAASVSGNTVGATTNLYTTQLRAIFYRTTYRPVSITER